MGDQAQDQSTSTGPIALAFLVLLAMMVMRGNGPPAAAGEQAPPSEFSAARAMHDVRAIAVRPHELGTPDNARVRTYLIARLQALGADPEVQTVMAARRPRHPGPLLFATVHNIIARFAGTNSSGIVMLAAHYDSVPSGPGAGDDGSGVAAILETVRALKSGPALRNDLLVVFTDGEELGMIGAQGFVQNFAALKDIRVALNFEMRGDQGASVMFQTSFPNQWLIDQFAGAAPYPRASSLTDAVYHRLPNDTDLTVFMQAGLAGMNFGVTGGLPRYHTRLDNPDLLDPGSLQHQGFYALALTRRFGSMWLPRAGGDSAVYFTLANRAIYYTNHLALPLAVLIAMLVALLMFSELRGGQIRVWHALAGLIAFAAAFVLAVAIAWAYWNLVARIAGDRMLPSGTTYGGPYFAAALVALEFATLWAIYNLLGRMASARALGAGALAGWALLMLLTARALPGGSYLLTWPLLFAVVAAGVAAAGPYRETAFGLSICAVIALAPGVIFLAPLVAIGAEATVQFLMLSAIGCWLLFAIAIPYLDVLSARRKWIAPIALLIIAVALSLRGNAVSPFDAQHPRPDSIFYLLDADAQQAEWISVDPRPDRFTAQFFRHHVRGGTLERIADPLTAAKDDETGPPPMPFPGPAGGRTIEGDAPVARLAPPTLSPVSDSTGADGIRIVTLHIESARHAPVMWMSVPAGTAVIDSSADGTSPGPGATDRWYAWYWGVPDGGFDLTLKVKGGGRLALTLIDQSNGLPASAAAAFAPRTDDEMPTPFVFFDSVALVRKTYVIGAGAIVER